MDEITLSSTEFKALSSDTRTGIIKLLNERNHTLSELSKKMALAAPTVKQHLSVLGQAGLIQCIDKGRKWKYYSLTKKGRKIIEPEGTVNVFIVLALSIIGIAAVAYLLVGGMSLAAASTERFESEKDTVIGAPADTVTGGEAVDETGKAVNGTEEGPAASRAAEPVGTAAGAFPIEVVLMIIGAIFVVLAVVSIIKIAGKK